MHDYCEQDHAYTRTTRRNEKEGFINGKYDKILNPINSKQITNTFIALGAKIQSKELETGHEFPKLSRDVINEWIELKN